MNYLPPVELMSVSDHSCPPAFEVLGSAPATFFEDPTMSESQKQSSLVPVRFAVVPMLNGRTMLMVTANQPLVAPHADTISKLAHFLPATRNLVRLAKNSHFTSQTYSIDFDRRTFPMQSITRISSSSPLPPPYYSSKQNTARPIPPAYVALGDECHLVANNLAQGASVGICDVDHLLNAVEQSCAESKPSVTDRGAVRQALHRAIHDLDEARAPAYRRLAQITHMTERLHRMSESPILSTLRNSAMLITPSKMNSAIFRAALNYSQSL